jgi:flagellar assembly factor FliW
MTANLKAPLIFNLKNRRGKQVILNTSTYTTRHNIMEEVRKRTAGEESASVQEAVQKAKADQAAQADASSGSSKKG